MGLNMTVDTPELAYVCVNQTNPELGDLMRIGTWLQANLAPNTYGFDLRTNTWKFDSQESLTWFLLVWSI